MSENPYSVLGLSPGASDDEIKKKYRTLVKQYHPDLHPDDPEAARKMSEINEAYEMIKSGNAGQTGAYGGGYSNQYGSSAPYGSFTRDGTDYEYQYVDFDDILRSFFGGFGFTARQSAERISPEQAYERIDEYIGSGDYQSAAALLNRFSAASRDGRWYFYAAEVCDGTGDYSSAVKYSDEAVRLDPSNKVYSDYSKELHKRHGFEIRIRRILPAVMSALAVILVFSFAARMIGSLFAWMFI